MAILETHTSAWHKTAFTLTPDQVLRFEREGHILLKQILPKDTLHNLKQEIDVVVASKRLAALQHRVRVLCPTVQHMPTTEQQALKLLRQTATDSVGFLQFFNNWASSELVRTLVCSEAMAGVAAQLLGVPKLRMFQDCVFHKEPGFANTNWHSDLRMVPLDTNHFVTAWVPLRPIQGPPQQDPHQPPSEKPTTQQQPQPTSAAGSLPGEQAGTAQDLTSGTSTAATKKRAWRSRRTLLSADEMEDSGLLFAVGSHRDFALPFWYDVQAMDLSGRYKLSSTGSMDVGDVSFHHGWTLHAAGPQQRGSAPRTALAVSYFGDGARLLRRSSDCFHKDMLHNEDEDSYAGWMQEMKDGAVASHPRLPVVYPVPKGGLLPPHLGDEVVGERARGRGESVSGADGVTGPGKKVVGVVGQRQPGVGRGGGAGRDGAAMGGGKRQAVIGQGGRGRAAPERAVCALRTSVVGGKNVSRWFCR